MALTGWITRSTQAPGRRTFGEDNSAVTSKNTRRYGSQGSKTDFPNSSTGENPAKLETRELPPSAPSKTHVDRAVHSVQTVGHQPDGSGRFVKPSYVNSGRHGLDGLHDPSSSTDHAQGQAWSAGAGQVGKQSIVPAKKAEQRPGDHGMQRSTKQDAGALAGNPGDRTRYSGGKGRV